ncbi:hypothetical protein ACFFTM_00720 [Pseudoduganella plicata]|nr:hypothetical protein [Pseudoduganella plicata]QBQ36554.1 hypothetical protein E1742_10570 [Pseudoduganella plicata]
MRGIAFRLVPWGLLILAGVLLGWRLTWRDVLVYSFERPLQDGFTVRIYRYGSQPVPWLDFSPHYAMRIYGASTYHEVDIPACAPFDVQQCLSRSTLLETVNGLSFTQPLGHRIFVPRELYANGR